MNHTAFFPLIFTHKKQKELSTCSVNVYELDDLGGVSENVARMAGIGLLGVILEALSPREGDKFNVLIAQSE